MESKGENNIFGVENNTDPMDQTTALTILVNAVQVGQNRGVWRLEEASILYKAIQTFSKK